jgi:hypothetical protein
MIAQILKEEFLEIEGGRIPIHLLREDLGFEDDDGDLFSVAIDGVEWFVTESQIHAFVLFEMMKDHILEYFHYCKI